MTVVLFRVEEVGGLRCPDRGAAGGGGGGRGEEPGGEHDEAPTEVDAPAADPVAPAALAPALAQEPAAPRRPMLARSRRRAPRMPRTRAPRRQRRLRRRLIAGVVVLVVLAVIAIGGVLAGEAVYFVGTDANGQVTVYNGLPYTLPGGVRLYTQYFVSGVTVAELSPLEQHRLFNNELRSQASATRLVSQLELDQIAGQ